MASRTYAVGSGSYVKRLDDVDQGNFIWVNKILPYSGSTFLFDVKSDPVDANKIFIAGRSTTTAPNPFPGLALSIDGGDTWVSCGGVYPQTAGMAYYKISVVSSSIIYACGKNGVVVKSTDGGYTFNQVGFLPVSVASADIYSIYFYSNLVGVIGIDDRVLKTINGGVSWTIQNGGQSLLGAGQVRGLYMPNTQIIIACGRNWITRSIDGGVNFSAVPNHVWAFDTGNNLAVFKAGATTILWAVGENEQAVRSTDLGDTWQILSTFNPLPTAYNYTTAYFYDSQTGFYGVNSSAYFGALYVQNNSAGSILVPPSYTDGSLKNVSAIWSQTIPPLCYRLTHCVTGVSYVTRTNLSALLGTAVRFSIIDISAGILLPIAGCYEVSLSSTCTGAVDVQINIQYDNCGECVNSCYLIVNCQDENDFFISTDPVYNAYLNNYIELESCPNKCYFVTLTTNCTSVSDDSLGNIISVNNTCEDCLGIDVPEPFELQQRRIKPGFNTPGCPPEYTVKISCKFAEQVYDEMVAIRYGVSICCDHDVDRWDIKKRMLDLSALYDPDLCVSAASESCLPPCNVTGVVNAYIVYTDQDACPEPTEVEGTFSIPADPCPDPSDIGIIVTFGYGTP